MLLFYNNKKIKKCDTKGGKIAARPYRRRAGFITNTPLSNHTKYTNRKINIMIN